MTHTPVLAYGPPRPADAISPPWSAAEQNNRRAEYDQLQARIAGAERIRTALRTAAGVLIRENAPETVAHPASRALDQAELHVAALRRKEARILSIALEHGIDLELDADLR